GASSIKDMGKVMAQLKPKMQGRADMGAVSGKIKSRLNAA
ncbi:MAG: GatB/YqeY domain-containing protein, partial [Gammaproteobacteria bacterium]|nr:GatB/YqeY domain-containing protein [Gammaproteobacteria bacterium]